MVILYTYILFNCSFSYSLSELTFQIKKLKSLITLFCSFRRKDKWVLDYLPISHYKNLDMGYTKQFHSMHNALVFTDFLALHIPLGNFYSMLWICSVRNNLIISFQSFFPQIWVCDLVLWLSSWHEMMRDIKNSICDFHNVTIQWTLREIGSTVDTEFQWQ